MKYLLLIFSVFVISCNQPLEKAFYRSQDSLKIELLKDSICEFNYSIKQIKSESDSMKAVCDTLRSKLFMSNYKIEKVRFYLKICMRDKTQDKFLKGWVRRAIE